MPSVEDVHHIDTKTHIHKVAKSKRQRVVLIREIRGLFEDEGENADDYDFEGKV